MLDETKVPPEDKYEPVRRIVMEKIKAIADEHKCGIQAAITLREPGEKFTSSFVHNVNTMELAEAVQNLITKYPNIIKVLIMDHMLGEHKRKEG